MKSSLPAITMVVLCASLCSPAFATPPTQVVKVAAPPAPISTSATKSSKPSPAVLRLPTQAGKVSKVVATSLVQKTPSWIAKGDKYYSLCVPNRRMVACAPIVPASVMKDIEVGANVGTKGEPLLTFKIAPGTKQAPKRVQYVISHFLARTKKQAAHFNRMAVSYAPRPAETFLRIGATSSLVDASDGGGSITCSYDDEGSYDCTGGSYGGGGGGSGGYDPIPGSVSTPNEPAGQCQANCDYPSGNNNGDADPCIDAAGNNTCQVVEIPGQRPPPEEPVELVGCRPVNPWTVECGRLPPVIGGEPQQIPSSTPWFPQAMCNLAHVFCSAGQEPDNDRGDDTSLSGKTLDQLIAICERIYNNEMSQLDLYLRLRNIDYREYRMRSTYAIERQTACINTAKRVTDNGAHAAP